MPVAVRSESHSDVGAVAHQRKGDHIGESVELHWLPSSSWTNYKIWMIVYTSFIMWPGQPGYLVRVG